MDILIGLIIAVFALLVIANFMLQIYVATLLRGGIGGLFFALRGTKVFIQGWQQAERLGIKPIMTAWTWILVAMIVFICPTGIAGYYRNVDQADTNSGGNNITRPPSLTPHAIRWEITSPKAGDTLHHSDGTVPIIGYVDYNIQQVEKYQFWIRSQMLGQTAGLGEFQYEPRPEPGSQLASFVPEFYPVGEWQIALELVPRNGQRTSPENLEWIPITIAP